MFLVAPNQAKQYTNFTLFFNCKSVDMFLVAPNQAKQYTNLTPFFNSKSVDMFLVAPNRANFTLFFNFRKQTTNNLKFLHSEQALFDLAGFIQAKNKELNLSKPKWVVFGGSYPGALALWFREKFPDLTVGAVGSSAPIEPRLDFFGTLFQ
jgi:pimeloyl-ACP methyl ester carboxylesterase